MRSPPLVAMPKFSKEDLDQITTYTGITAAVCFGVASTIASTLSAVPGDKIMGVSKVPFTAAGAFLGGMGAIALGIQGTFTNKTASMHPTTADLEQRASVQEQADFFKYSPNGGVTAQQVTAQQTVETGISRDGMGERLEAAIACDHEADDDEETYYLLSEHLPVTAPSPQNFNDEA